jgi:hypothetical protein
MTKPPESDVLSQLTAFLGRYLQCSEHQRVVLALWLLHTYTFSAAHVTPFLSIQSSYKQSGKTFCLQLLGLLSHNPLYTSALTASALARVKPKPSAVFLDECQATFGTRSKAKALALRALLAGSFHRDPLGADAITLPSALPFCPKAFAGVGQLPQELADRSISIILEPLGARTFLGFDYRRQRVVGGKPPFSHSHVEHPPSASWGMSDIAPGEISTPGEPPARDHVSQLNSMGQQPPSAASYNDGIPNVAEFPRFNLSQIAKDAQPLKKLLSAWAKDNLARLMDLPPYPRQDFPPDFSSRRQDLCEPLLHLADAVGGLWSKRARRALYLVFEQEAAFDFQPALQLLQDIQHCFVFHNNPDRLATSTLLDWMHNLPARPWDVDGPLTSRMLARLLLALDIRPRLRRLGQEGPARGYQVQDFEDAWRRHLEAMPIHRFRAAFGPNFRYDSLQQPDFLHKDTPLPPEVEALLDQAKGNTQTHDSIAETAPISPTLAPVQSKTQNQKSQIPNNHAVCNGLAESVNAASAQVATDHLPAQLTPSPDASMGLSSSSN